MDNDVDVTHCGTTSIIDLAEDGEPKCVQAHAAVATTSSEIIDLTADEDVDVASDGIIDLTGDSNFGS